MALESIDRQLRYFLRVAELKSLSKAADDLDQTQSGISKQLAALEANLGQALFSRTGRGVELTEAGAQLFGQLQPAYRDIDRAVEEARRQGVTHGTVRLATVHTLSYYFTADVVARFVSARPNANLSLLGRSSPEVVALVESGKADIGFVYDAAVDSGDLVATPLFEDAMALFVRASSDLTGPLDLTKLDLRLVAFPGPYALRRMLHSAGLNPTYTAEAETIDAMLQLVSSGVGNCVLPDRIPAKMLVEHGLKKVGIAIPDLRRRVVAIRRVDRPASPLIAELEKYAFQVAKELRPS